MYRPGVNHAIFYKHFRTSRSVTNQTEGPINPTTEKAGLQNPHEITKNKNSWYQKETRFQRGGKSMRSQQFHNRKTFTESLHVYVLAFRGIKRQNRAKTIRPGQFHVIVKASGARFGIWKAPRKVRQRKSWGNFWGDPEFEQKQPEMPGGPPQINDGQGYRRSP